MDPLEVRVLRFEAETTTESTDANQLCSNRTLRSVAESFSQSVSQ